MYARCPGCGRTNRFSPERASPKCGACHGPLDPKNAPFLVDDDGLDALIASSPVPVLVDFYADWCGPCRALAPHLTELAARNTGRLFVAKVDTERSQRRMAALGITGIPALYLFKDGKIVANTAGLQPPAALDAFVRPHLG
jgi:thioredoxin 2